MVTSESQQLQPRKQAKSSTATQQDDCQHAGSITHGDRFIPQRIANDANQHIY
jgi:hypothetical protein